MTGLSLLLVAAATAVDFGWQPQADGHLEYVIQIAPSQVELLKNGQIVINDIPPDVRGGRSFVLKVGAGDVPRQGRVAPQAPGGGLGQGAGLIGRTTGPSTARQAPRFAPAGGPALQPEAAPAGNPPAFFAQPVDAQVPLQPNPNFAQPGVAPAPALLPANAFAGPQGQPQPNEALRAPELALPPPPQNAPLQPIPQPQFAQPQFAQPQIVHPNPALQPQAAQPNPALQPNRTVLANPAAPAWPNVAQPNFAQPNVAQPNLNQPNFAQPPLAQPNFAQPNFAQPNPVAAPAAAAADPRWNDPRVNLAPAVVSRPGDPVPAAGPWPAFPQGAPPRDDSPLLAPVGQNPIAAPTRPPQVDVRGQPWEPVAQDPRLAPPNLGADPRFDPIQPRIDPWQRRWDPPADNDNFNGPVRNDVADRGEVDARWANARWDGSRWTMPRGNRADNPIRDTSFRSRNGGPNLNAREQQRGFPDDNDRFAGDPNDRWRDDPIERRQNDPVDRRQNDPNDRWRDNPNDRWQNDPNERFNTIPVGYSLTPASGLGIGAVDALRHDRNATGTMLSTGKVPVSSTPSKTAAAAAALDARDQTWMPWTITTLGLFLSIGANLYLWWIWSDSHRRYLMLIAEMRGARS